MKDIHAKFDKIKHDTYDKMVPLAIAKEGHSAFTLLLPYLEQDNLYNQLDTMGQPDQGISLTALTSDGAKGLSVFMCPSRSAREMNGNGGGHYQGTGFAAYDYGILTYHGGNTGWDEWNLHNDASQSNQPTRRGRPRSCGASGCRSRLPSSHASRGTSSSGIR